MSAAVAIRFAERQSGPVSRPDHDEPILWAETESSELPLAGRTVFVIGGAAAGAEVAELMARDGALVIVFEKDTSPFGKIRSGLPDWHSQQKMREYAAIVDKLSSPNILFVPETVIGEDGITLEALQRFNPAAIFIATGAEKDRPAKIAGIEAFLDKGVNYQNRWQAEFSQWVEGGNDWRDFEVGNSVIIQGGGLASLDMAKLWIFIKVARWLRDKKKVDVTLEQLNGGVNEALAQHDATFEQTGISRPLLLYRDAKEMMPLAKNAQATAKLIEVAQRKYLIEFEYNQIVLEVGAVPGGDRLGKVQTAQTSVTQSDTGKKVMPVQGTERQRAADLLLFSMGSVVDPIKGLPLQGNVYSYRNDPGADKFGLPTDTPGVIVVGNALHGQGSIRISRESGQQGYKFALHAFSPNGHENGYHQHEGVMQYLRQRPRTTLGEAGGMAALIEMRWMASGYRGNLRQWLANHGYSQFAQAPVKEQDMVVA